MDLLRIAKGFPEETIAPRPYVNHSVELKNVFTRQERIKALEEAGLNVFFFPSELICGCDLLSDSGTTTMTNTQWAILHMGDEAYGSNRGYFKLRERIITVFGEKFFNPPSLRRPNAFFFHQGRPAEDAFFSIMGTFGTDLIIPSNGHFDTTEANIEAHRIRPLNLFSPELKDDKSVSHFKGNMNVREFEKLLAKYPEKIPLVYLTITNNTGGGQPVSMANIKAVHDLAHAHRIPVFFDACRFAENAWFIKTYERGYAAKSISAIVREMFSYVDGFTISFKKDGLVNMGGGLFLKDGGLFVKKYPSVPDAITNYQIRTEGHPTYGGMSGRDIMALSEGLGIITKQEYLDWRVRQVRDFGESMQKAGIPVLTPIGGHAVYLDINKFFSGTNMKPSDFGGISLTALLLGLYGHRACELGYFAFGSFDAKTGAETFPEVNFVRFAVPRLRYEKQDFDACAQAVKLLHDRRDTIPPVDVVYGKDLPLRHFKARFAFR